MKAIGIVRLVKDAERKTDSGPLKCRAAWDHRERGEKVGNFIDVNVWGKSADNLAPFMVKGAQFEVCGELKSREYEGKTYWSIDADGFGGVTLCGGRGEKKAEAPTEVIDGTPWDDGDPCPF